MGRYSTDFVGNSNFNVNQNDYQSQYSTGSLMMNQASSTSGVWPTTFNKPMVGLDLNGTIIEDINITGAESVKLLPTVLEAIRSIRLKGYKVFILSDQPGITKGYTSEKNIQSAFQELMRIFGQAGIISIDGFLHNTSDIKNDEFAKPNLGMVKRAENEVLKGSTKFKDGWYVGDSLIDLKYADKMQAKPVLIKTGNYQHAITQLEKFTYRNLKSKTKIYNSLSEFASSLP